MQGYEHGVEWGRGGRANDDKMLRIEEEQFAVEVVLCGRSGQ
jgi:hypothetical protein